MSSDHKLPENNAGFQGKLIVITAPSGAGKTTITRHLLSSFDCFDFSVSATTRKRRSYEEHGKHYYFINEKKFKALVKEKAFVEWEEVYEGQFYGTLKAEVERIWANGKHIIFDIDVKGARNIKKLYKDRCMAVFIKPPSLEVLVERLIYRRTEDPKSLKKRIQKVKRELKYEKKFDQVLINDKLDFALKEAENLILLFLEKDCILKDESTDNTRHKNLS